MRNLLQHISILFWVCTGLALGACSSDSISDSHLLNKEGDGNDVILNLRVSLDNVSSTGLTRDGEGEGSGEGEGENTGEETPTAPKYEDGLNPYELINTLRVIIVRPDNTVEYNRLISVKENSIDPTNVLANLEDLKFRVSTSQGIVNIGNNSRTCTEKKRIYLIANEASLEACGSEQTANIIRELRNLKPSFYDKVDENEEMPVSYRGDKLEPDKVAKWLVYNDWEENGKFAIPIIDNTVKTTSGDNTGDDSTGGETTEAKFIPMTEFFDIEVQADLNRPNNQLTTQQVNLFVTRNFVKFQFSTTHAEGTNETFKIHKVTFSNLMRKEYMFPFETTYKPAKYPVSSVDREIIEFKTPGFAGNSTLPYEFSPENFGILSEGFTIGDREELNNLSNQYEPHLYFCETENYETNGDRGIYKVGIDIEFFNPDGTSIRTVFEPKELNHLSSIPRNTIVKVNFKIGKRELIDCLVTVFPYTSVWLNPEFGFAPPITDQLTVEPTMDLQLNGMDGLLYPKFTSDKGNTIQNLYWVSSNPSIVLLGNEVTDETDQRYVEPSESIELSYLQMVDDKEEPVPVRVVPQGVGTAYVTVYTQSGLVARCLVTVKE